MKQSLVAVIAVFMRGLRNQKTFRAYALASLAIYSLP